MDYSDRDITRRLALAKRSEQALHAAKGKPMASVMTPKLPCGTAGERNIELVTNVYGLTPTDAGKKLNRYDVRIFGIHVTGRELEFTGKAFGDTMLIERRNRCREIFMAFKAQQKDLLLEGVFGIYDLASILYTDALLDLQEETQRFPIDCTGFESEDFSLFTGCVVALKKVQEISQMCIGDFSTSITAQLQDYDHSLAQYMDIATSQYVFFTPNEHISFSAALSYQTQPGIYGFTEEDIPELTEDLSFMSVGCHKNTRFIEGPKGTGGTHPAVVVAVKKTTFHCMVTVLEKAKCFFRNIDTLENGNFVKLSEKLKGIYFETSYGAKKQKHKISEIVRDSAQTWKIEIEGSGSISVQQYFKNKHNIDLSHPHLPLICAKGRANMILYFPMELCMISDNQRVRIEQHVFGIEEELIKSSAIPPFKLKDQISNTVKSLHLADSELLRMAGLKFVPKPLILPAARIIPPPSIEYSSEKVLVKRNGTWMDKKYIIPKDINSWVIYGLLTQHDKLRQDDLDAFVKNFIISAKAKGMNVTMPSDTGIFTSGTELVHAKLKAASDKKYEFVLMVHPDDKKIHDALKWSERKYEVTTQGLLIDTVKKILSKGQPATMNNILHKTNVKMGGLNYSLFLDNSTSAKVLAVGSLYIGVGANHPRNAEVEAAINGNGQNDNGHNGNGHNGSNGRNGVNGQNGIDFQGAINGQNGNSSGSSAGKNSLGGLQAKGSPKCNLKFPPSIIGYSSNIGRHPFEFIGDFLLQEPRRDEKPDQIRRIVERCVKRYRENRGTEVQRIFIYRNGCDQGSFDQILKYEVPFIKLALKDMGCPAKIVVIIPNKMHYIRFFPKDIDQKDTPSDQNIRPGTVIDSNVVHPTFCEFYLNPHTALQGTAKTPRFTVLFNEMAKVSMDDLQGITYQLCYGHQIVSSPTSLPAPSYIADCYALRGRNIFNEWWNLPHSEPDENARYEDIEAFLTYHNNEVLGRKRINA